MVNRPDSLKIVKKSLDSLKEIVASEWHGIKIHEPAVQAALLVAISTVITVALGFVFKDYFIPRWIEKRTRKLESQNLFKQYKSQLISTCFTFLKRLHEIYVTRSHYLWKETPMSDFYQYKYKSSVYRLCVLLGATRAYRLIESSLIIEDYGISKTINTVESCLADGQQVEMYVARAICEINEIEVQSLDPHVLEKLSVEIDNLVQQFQEEKQEEYIGDLSSEKQDEFIQSLGELMNDLNIPVLGIIEKKKEIVKEVSIKLALIYRDWQQAIGDLMLKVSNNGIYTVISFKDFEKKWDAYKKSGGNIWFERVEKIFENLDLRIDHYSDTRINQLKLVYENVYKLMANLYNIDPQESPINESVFKSVSKTI